MPGVDGAARIRPARISQPGIGLPVPGGGIAAKPAAPRCSTTRRISLRSRRSAGTCSNGRDNGGAPDIGNLHESSCECLARYSAPLVLDRVDLAAHSPVLVVGWGGETYRETALARWPRLVFETRNPFAGGRNGGPAAAIPAGDGPYGAVMFSGMLSCCERDQYQPALAHAAGVLRPGGLLVLHDSFLGSETSPSPEVLLSALGRHVIQGGCRNWSVGRLTNTLDVLGLRVLETHPIPSGTQLVTASKL